MTIYFVFYRLQAVAYAKKYGVPVLRWANPVRNYNDKEYSIDIIESLLPGAVQYFVLGAPANIIQNHNPVSTGIVNGSRVLMHSLVWGDGYRWQPPAGARPGQMHTVPRPAYMVVVLDVDVSKNEDARLSEQDLIPLRLEHAEDVVQNVKLTFKQFPLDLGFATTFHKVQGQTLQRVIMFLHERKAKQLAKLQWESLYVAMTRVKSGDNMRVCYRGSEDTTRKNTNGLQHLKKLRRPELYDVWQAAYDKDGYWDPTNLEREALRAQCCLRRKLKCVTSLCNTRLKKLKEWCSVLDVVVKYKPGTKYRNKPQYLEALRPIWLACRNRKMHSYGQLKNRQKKVYSQTKHKSVQLKKCRKKSNSTSKRKPSVSKRRKRQRVSPSGRNTSEGSCRHLLVPPRSTDVDLDFVRNKRVHIKVQKRNHRDSYMQQQVYAEVNNVKFTLRQFHDLAVKGKFTDCTVLNFMLQRMCPLAHVPTYWCDTQIAIETFFEEEARRPETLQNHLRIATSWVQRIESGGVMMLPYNYPRNTHWVAVFVWKDDDGYHVQSRNSYARFTGMNNNFILKHAQTFISKIYRLSKAAALPTWDAQSAIVPLPTQHVVQQNTNECAFHVVANGVLAEKGFCFSHTFNNTYVDYIRNIHIQLLARNETTRYVVKTIE